MSDKDRKPNPRELQALMGLDSEFEDNESAGSGNFDHEEETVIAPHARVNCVEKGSDILEVYGWNYGYLIKTNQTNVGRVMVNWDLHDWRYFCYNCNQQLLFNSLFGAWSCPLCESLEMSRAEGEVCWHLGECPHCYNVGPAGLRCLTCLVNDGNMETWKAFKVALDKYKKNPAVLNRKEFAVWVNYFYYLHEQGVEVNTWDELMWYERYVKPPYTLEGQPMKLVHWICS
jgi:hypothetical protein